MRRQTRTRRRTSLTIAGSAVLTLLSACVSSEGAPPRRSARESIIPTEQRRPAPESARIEPVAGVPGAQGQPAGLLVPSPLLDLEVPGHGPAVVSVPLGATSPRPVLIAAHGAGDRPDWQCQMWRSIVENRGFVLCPRGRPMYPSAPPDQGGYFYPDHNALKKEVDASLDALRVRFPSYVDTRAVIYAGFSQGAIMGAPVVAMSPDRFPRAVLIEGGTKHWIPYIAKQFKKGGGEKVLFACGRPQCFSGAKRSASNLEKAGVEELVVGEERAGHTYGGPIAEEIRKAFAWIVEGDPRWLTPEEAAR